jgi:hypothetical protein
MESHTSIKIEDERVYRRPIYRNVRLFVKLFIVSFKYIFAIGGLALAAIYSYYYFFTSDLLITAFIGVFKNFFPSAEVDGANSAGSRLQGCVIPDIPTCEGRAFSDKVIFSPVN